MTASKKPQRPVAKGVPARVSASIADAARHLPPSGVAERLLTDERMETVWRFLLRQNADQEAVAQHLLFNDAGLLTTWDSEQKFSPQQRAAEQPLGGRSSCPVRQRMNRPVADSSSYRHGADRHIDMHAYRVVFTANESARDGDRLGGLAGYADAYQVRAGNQTVGRVVFDPASAGQIDAAPGMRASAAAGLARCIVIKIAGDEARRDAVAAQSLHHQHGEVAARAGAELYGLGRRLRTLLIAGAIAEFLLDGPRHRLQHLQCFSGARVSDDALSPGVDLMVWVRHLPFGE